MFAASSPMRAAALAAMLAPALPVHAEAESLRFATVVVSGPTATAAGSVSAEAMRQVDALTAGTTLELLDGVSQGRVRTRGERMVYVRDFDLRQVPIPIDCVQVRVPYDGSRDPGRFTTLDLARVQFDKGGASLLAERSTATTNAL